MRYRHFAATAALLVSVGVSAGIAVAQDGPGDGDRPRPRDGGPRDRGPRDGAPRLPPIPILEALDSNGDGMLDATEIEQAAKALKSLDRDNDGVLSFQEMMPAPRGDRGPGGPQGRGDRPEMRDGQGRPDGEGRRPRPEGEGNRRGGNPEQFVERIMKLDKDGDGKLSGEELPERMRAMLSRADVDGDDALSKEELMKMAERRGRQGGGEGRRRPDGEKPTEGGERPRRPPAE
ncbi:hypothetical protein [Rosistilla oblonga]|uniref:hypothetical protein n=1 Tax=Rosistilla oblonga TaxID=2527990 RepID=UPI003A974307